MFSSEFKYSEEHTVTLSLPSNDELIHNKNGLTPTCRVFVCDQLNAVSVLHCVLLVQLQTEEEILSNVRLV